MVLYVCLLCICVCMNVRLCNCVYVFELVNILLFNF